MRWATEVGSRGGPVDHTGMAHCRAQAVTSPRRASPASRLVVIGLAVGALLRNQIVAVVAALVWLLVAEQLLLDALPGVGRWTPGGATYGLLQLGPAATRRGTLLDAPVGGLLLVGYTAAAVALALVVAPRRDVL